MRPYFFLLPAAMAAMVAQGADREIRSASTRTSLVELYTSEGCSSCPPAERWLGSLRQSPGLWRDFVPVEFHVNYWDRLGWPDRFASKQATAREYTYASAWGSGSVYTPCFVRDGAEWHPGGGAPPASRAEAGVLALTLADDGSCRVSFSPAGSAAVDRKRDWEIHVAVLGNDISSRVTAGENRGETLQHAFVALALSEHLLAPTPGGALEATFPLPASSVTGVPRRALAAWVTRRGELVPIQAAGGWLD